MDPLVIIFGGALLLTLFAPWIGAEDRPSFRRPDRKARPMTGSMRSSDWGRGSGWPF